MCGAAALRDAKDRVTTDDPDTILFTSGTMERPKPVLTTHFSRVNIMLSQANVLEATEQDRFCSVLPMYHCFSLTATVLAAMTAGACVCFPADRHGKTILETIQRERCTILTAVPTGTVGEICIRGYNVMQSYYKLPADKQARRWVNPVAMEAATGTMIRKPAFWLYYLWAILLSAAGLALISQASGVAREIGTDVSAGTIATVVGLISVCNGVGRVILGALFDKVGRSKTMQTVNVLFLLTCGVLILSLSLKSFPILVAGFVLGGFSYGGVTPTNSAFVSSYYGLKNFPLNFSIINTNLIIASFGSTVAGALYDASQSYFSTDAMIGVLAVLGIFVSLAISVCDKRALAAR